MTGSAAVDSNAYVALCNGDVRAASVIGSFPTICLPVVVLAELLYGAGVSARAAQNRRRVEEFAAKCDLLEVTRKVGEQYAGTRMHLRAAGRPIPDNDLWIAAACLVAGVPLITRDGHFSHVPTLQIVTW